MKALVNSILGAALCLALALPAAAGAQTSSLRSLPAGSPGGSQPSSGNGGPRAAFLRLHAERTAPTTSGHFDFPYALATDGAGNVFVANTDGNYINKITPGLRVASLKITKNLANPFSLAIDPEKDIYAGNESGGIQQYAPTGSYLSTITANASSPFGIAVDQFQDVFVTSPAGLAIDDSSGNSIYSDIFSPGSQLYSVTFGGSNVYTFYNATAAFGSGSFALRAGSLQYEVGPLSTQEPVGSACTTGELCWWDDSLGDTLSKAEFPGSIDSVGLPYSPAGIAYDPLHHRLFVADPTQNAVQVYNSSTLAFIQTIT